MRFLRTLGKIIAWPFKMLFKLFWFLFKLALKAVKWILMTPLRWISGLVITIAVVALLIWLFVF